MSEENYRFWAARAARYQKPEELALPVETFLRKLRTFDPAHFILSAYDILRAKAPLLPGDESHVTELLAGSEIRWAGGREERFPTNDLIATNDREEPDDVYLSVQFVSGNARATCSGLLVELRVGRAAAGPEDDTCGQHLTTIFKALVESFEPDAAHLELPGSPIALFSTPSVGWLNYYARSARGELGDLPKDTIVERWALGTTVRVTKQLGVQKHSDLAKEIEALRRALEAKRSEEPPAPRREPEALPTHPVQKPSYLRDPATPPLEAMETQTMAVPDPALLERSKGATLQGSTRSGAALPFQNQPPPPPAAAPKPATQPMSIDELISETLHLSPDQAKKAAEKPPTPFAPKDEDDKPKK